MAKCKICKEKFTPKYSSLEPCCGNIECKDAFRKSAFEGKKQRKPIKKVSDKKAIEDIVYKSERIKFLIFNLWQYVKFVKRSSHLNTQV